ncbi:MAG: sulfite exporter TauE/SafE family protein [Phycisphaerae bacterium]|nr:sulfite exporter TauE/SafE family protein [Phycisphaerae bacterium]
MIELVPIFIGLLAGALGGMLGVGGSIFIIPGLVFYFGQTEGFTGKHQHLAQAAAMICNIFVAAPAVRAHLKARVVVKKIVLVLVPTAIAGIIVGVMISNSRYFSKENGRYLTLALGGFLIYVAVYNLWKIFQKGANLDSTQYVYDKPLWMVALVGLPMGLSAGLLGIGGGALCVPFLQMVLKVPLRRAIGCSAFTIVCVAMIGAVYKNATLAEHGFAVSRSLSLAGMIIPTAIIGSYFGARLSHKVPQKVLRIIFVVFMLVTAAKMFSQVL